jgi:predicted site-specific integrase-resolvase
MFRTNDAAEYIGLTKATLEAWRCKGGGPVFVKYQRAVRYRKEDLDAFIQQSLQRNTSQANAAGAGR